MKEIGDGQRKGVERGRRWREEGVQEMNSSGKRTTSRKGKEGGERKEVDIGRGWTTECGRYRNGDRERKG